jgi:hypothetical protein
MSCLGVQQVDECLLLRVRAWIKRYAKLVGFLER